ncbi:MAG: hydrogenase [Desulfuromonas sp.]|uniref:Ni/Fe hydrogenase subunit alpha n=1 Tax=Desulfuromonas sp. TaxID=892 RepID=UPI000CB37CA4|nr:nickel-dependent hydrogenase large subunit [Desulfuromonas sp.]PLX82530.1 MAG: hydrogenase [Desulfuromonas sp.]
MKTLHLEPLTRVEGHGRVELVLEGGELLEARVALLEAPRLFEGLLLGRSFAEVPALVCRICAICSSVHRVTAAAALEDALGVEVPAAAWRVRDLLLVGGHIESHALHLFCLVLPDLAGVPSVLELLREDHPAARGGLALKALGNRIQEVAGGRAIHPVNVEVGGVLRLPERSVLEGLRDDLAAWEARLPSVLEPFGDPAGYPPSSPVVGVGLCVKASAEVLLRGETLALADGREVPVEGYHGLLSEQPSSYSNAKRAGEVLLTGALARQGREGLADSWPGGIHANNAAQTLELAWALERARRLVDALLDADPAAPLAGAVRPGAGVGTAAIEAPRGLLIHHYAIDDLGRVAVADIVTPTAVNQGAMEGQLLADLKGVDDEEELRARAERIVRAYDPCISCAVHVLNVGGCKPGG